MREGDRVRNRATKNVGILRKDNRRSSLAWYVERPEVPPEQRFYMGADELEHFLEYDAPSASSEVREAAKWEGEVSENSVPQCDAKLTLPPEISCICIFKDGERYHHGHCLAFHKTFAIGFVTDPNTLTVQRGFWSKR